MNEALPPQADPHGDLPAVLTVDELAEFLRVGRDTVYQAIAKGEIPGACRIGRTIRISRDAMLDWVRGKGHAPRSERGRK
ncbi:MAG: helix-turn-helix domain-containing protein [Candidatus Tectomicrobia bacterium]|uniref:Helix-turn-helix domain-containing protein n=1 Tax=Tectimicrobiota bacterium TaxID=2528274 RepID=A0A932MQB9_UNCTE|nr:helix-turn-helix domain-containing protein [Candidatus Tectomicrobia bacterium]